MKWIIGIDEAGRGPLAGPVSVGVVRVPHDLDLIALFPKLNDSKKLSEMSRDAIFEILKGTDISYTATFGSVEDIDSIGITKTVSNALTKGISGFGYEDTHVYLDGLLHAPPSYTQETVIGGDGKIPAIMLASVVAKVMRDQYMKELAIVIPNYGFETHKGYGTLAHRTAIQKHGLSGAHRKSFCTRVLA